MNTYVVVNIVEGSPTAARVFTDFIKAVECAAGMIHEQIVDEWDEKRDFGPFWKDKRDKLVSYFNFNTCYTVTDDVTVNVLTAE